MENKEIIRNMEKTNQTIDKMSEKIEHLENFYHEIKKLVREKGKSNYIKRQEIEELIVKYGG